MILRLLVSTTPITLESSELQKTKLKMLLISKLTLIQIVTKTLYP
jgi:hypothetical protein